MNDAFDNTVRYTLNRFIFENGYAPEVIDLNEILNAEPQRIESALQRLADNHALVLHPHSHKIWVAHPFALFPTLFWVKSGERTHWGNCAWCSMGIASLSKDNTTIFTRIGGEEETLQIEVVNGELVQKDLLVHFPIPARNLWDNVIFTCANILTFESEKQIDDWCMRHRMNKGEVVSLEKVWELSKLWYGNYLDPSWSRKTPEYAESIFKKVGLTSAFWKLG